MLRAAQPDETAKLAHPPRESPPSLDIQQLWFATLRWEWSTLVLVPADSRGSVVGIAKGLAQVGDLHCGRAVKITAEETSLASTSELVEDISGQSTIRPMNAGSERWKKRTIIALDPVLCDPAGIVVALAADAVLLCVELGKTNIAEARRTVQLIGRDRFIGCVIVK